MKEPLSKSRINSNPPRVLVTDDEPELRQMISLLLEQEGLICTTAKDAQEALKVLRQSPVDLMLLDIHMPDMDGLTLLREVHKTEPNLPVIMITSGGTVEKAKEAGKQGAMGFLTKPFKNDELIFSVVMALENRRGRQENQAISAQVQGSSLRDILGPSRVIGKVVAEVERIAPTDFTVIILGETGVGKEVVAHAIHRLSHRAQDPFVPVDCGSIPPTLIEAELFGHEKGAFTGAERSQAGCFEAAQGGTLFLDEIGNLPANMQTKILRALQERLVRRVGSTTSIKVDVRVLAATNENLPGMVEKGDFRRDLFYRLNEFCIQVPPLRQRGEDIIYLARRFLELTGEELKKDNLEFSPAAVQEFLNHPWPGNVRELRNVVRRAVLLAEKFIEPEHLGLAVPGPGESPLLSPRETNRDEENQGGEDQDQFEGLPLKDIIRQTIVKTERKVLQQVLGETGGNMAEAARVLGVDYKTIRNKTREYQIVGFGKRDGP